MKPKSVCFFNSSRSWGGGEKWHCDMSQRLARSGCRVSLVTKVNSELYLRAQKAGTDVQGVQVSNLSFLNPWKLLLLFVWFRRSRFDAVILNLPADLKVGGLAAKLAGVPKIIYRRGSATPVKDSLFNRFLLRRVVTELIANSAETGRTILASNPELVDPGKITVIYNGIDLDEYDRRPFSLLYEKQEGEIVLGCAGRLSWEKNQKFIVEVAALLRNRGLKFKLLIAGTGKLESELRAQVKSLDLEQHVLFLGFVENIKAFMESVDIFLLSSVYEGFGYVLVEAMASSRPVVAFSSSSTPEIVVDGKTGYLAGKDNKEAFAERILELSREPSLAQCFGTSGRERVCEMFEMEVSVRKLVSLI